MKKLTVCHIITDLDIGGAEMVLYRLVKGMQAHPFRHVVLSLSDRGKIGRKLDLLGVPVFCLNMKRPHGAVSAGWRLITLVRRINPALLQGWMYHGNLAAALDGFFTGRKTPVLWNVRHSLSDLSDEKRSTACLIRLGAAFSRRVAGIIYNSGVSAVQHQSAGYHAGRCRVIPNGFDTGEFRPRPELRTKVRQTLGFSESAVLVGMIARSHPMKGHECFLQAATRLAARHPDVGFVLAGRGVDLDNGRLLNLVDRLGIAGRVRLLGEREDMAGLLNAVDIQTSASIWGEGFPNIIGEAMACGVPCVVTDVGDSGFLVGHSGKIVTPGSVSALVDAWSEFLSIGAAARLKLGRAARQRIEARFSLSAMADQYAEMCGAGGSGGTQ